MRANLRLFWSGVRASWATYLVELTPTIFLSFRIPRIILQSLFFVYLAKAAGGDSMARFALIGNAIQIAVFMVMLSMEEVIESEKWNDTFQYLIASPANWFPMMLGKSMSYFGDALIAATASFSVLIPLLHVNIAFVNLLKAVPIILIIIASASALGWAIGAFSLPIRYGYMICNWVAYAMMIFCGVNIPTSALPPAIQVIGVEPYPGHKVQGLKNMKESYVPGLFDRHALDGVVNVKDEEAFEMARRLAKEDATWREQVRGAQVVTPDGGTELLDHVFYAAANRDDGLSARLVADFNVAPGNTPPPAGPQGLESRFLGGD